MRIAVIVKVIVRSKTRNPTDMPREGRNLEMLVTLFEGVLSPLGAIVKSPDFLDDLITGQKREVDISIRGKTGSADLLIICECRDRKALQDVTWIEQIAQKRGDVGAAKAIAISSSNFTEPALTKAKFLGIDTRLVNELTPAAIAEWFNAGSMTLRTLHADVVYASLDIGGYGSESKVAEESQTILREPNKTFTGNAFICKPDGETCSMSTIWSWVHSKQAHVINPTIPVSGERVRKTIDVNFSNPAQRYQLPMVDGLADIVSIRFVVDLWYSYREVPIENIFSYCDGSAELLETVRYKFCVDDTQYRLDLHRHPEGQTTVTTKFTPSKLKPEN